VKKKLRICRIATVPFFLQNHLREQACATALAGHDVTLVSSDGPEAPLLRSIPGLTFRAIEIPRQISPLRDLVALWQLYRLFRRERYDIVHSTTPKAGMLAAVAGYLAGIPVRLHTFTGQVWMEKRGMLRFLAKAGDRITAALNTQCYADSFSQRDFIIAEGVASPQQVRVIGEGSLAGVDLRRFDPAVWSARKDGIRAELGIAAGTKIITFIGRLNKDKGINELVTAFESLRRGGCDCVLLLIGPPDPDWATGASEVREQIEADPNIRSLGYRSEPERYLAVTDIFCLPSYREGFGNVVIEAAAMGVPTIGTDIVGLRDSIVNGETGLLVRPKDADALADALSALLADEGRRVAMGIKARARAVKHFDAQTVNSGVVEEYARLWQDRCANIG
jgi:glycosyltransferase involved in cell wall biosynthesis